MRPIDGNELHSEIQRMICSPKCASTEALDALTDVLLVISKTPTISNWIPCKERLPKESGRYLVTVKDDLAGSSYVLDAWFWTDNQVISALIGTDKTGWNLLYEFSDFTEELRDKIVAWMPQPKPYDFEDTECENGDEYK